MIARSISVLLLLAIAVSLSVHVENIHYGYRNIYQSSHFQLASSHLTLTNYKITKQELTPDVLGFVSPKQSGVSFDLNALVRQFEAEEIDPSAAMLTFRYFEKPFIIVAFHCDPDSEAEVETLNKMMFSGRDRSELDL